MNKTLQNEMCAVREDPLLKLSVSTNQGKLFLKANNIKNFYTYGELVEINKKFRAFTSIEEIQSFIEVLIRKRKIILMKDQSISLQIPGGHINIPLRLESLFVPESFISFVYHQAIQLQKIRNFKNNEKCQEKHHIIKPYETKVFRNSLSLPNLNLVSRNKIKALSRFEISSLCFLKDRRLVSSSKEIVIYSLKDFKADITIKEGTEVSSVYGLKNGFLASASLNIKIWEIKEKDYKLRYCLKNHSDWAKKIIELEDGKLCSCSYDKTIIIWENIKIYKPAVILKGHTHCINSVVEVSNFIISVGDKDDKSLRIWNISTYQCEKVFENWTSVNGLSKLNDKAIIIGGKNRLTKLDVLNFDFQLFEDAQLGNISCMTALKKGILMVGNDSGMLICFDSVYNKILLRTKIHEDRITALIEGEDDQIFSSSNDNIKSYLLCF